MCVVCIVFTLSEDSIKWLTVVLQQSSHVKEDVLVGIYQINNMALEHNTSPIPFFFYIKKNIYKVKVPLKWKNNNFLFVKYR